MIDNDFVNSIPQDLNGGVRFILDGMQEYHNAVGNNPAEDEHDMYIEYNALLESFLTSWNYPFSPVTFETNRGKNISLVVSFFGLIHNEFEARETKDVISESRSRFDAMFSVSFSYEFTDGDLDRIQVLINELRDYLSKSETFTAEHKARLLKRLEALQAELHKKVSDLDKIWGLLGDAGVAIGKFGEKVKPFTDRVREIAEIGWRTQANAEQLPSGTTTPYLSSGDESADD